MIQVAILGATGYTALELIKILLRHPEVEIAAVTSRQEGNPPLETVHPQLAGRTQLVLEDLNPEQVAQRADFVFSCLPHGASASAVAMIADAGKRVIDFSADYRLKDPVVFEKWYGQPHVDPARLPAAVYGLPELYRDQISAAQLVANPGCYPTSANLALAPLLQAGLIEQQGIVVDSKSGVSGAGRSLSLTTHYPECNESIAAYKVGEHRHTPEINQILSQVGGAEVKVLFTPHLVPMDRGILTTTYSQAAGGTTQQDLFDALHAFYDPQPCVRVVDRLPATKDSMNTNFCDITARIVEDRVVTISCLDNLLKGASGMAVQNLNLMAGFDETVALV